MYWGDPWIHGQYLRGVTVQENDRYETVDKKTRSCQSDYLGLMWSFATSRSFEMERSVYVYRGSQKLFLPLCRLVDLRRRGGVLVFNRNGSGL